MAVSVAVSVRRAAGLGLALVALLAGCGPKVDLLYVAEGFDFATIQSGGIVIGGVANLVRDPEAGLESPERINALMETVLIRERGDLRFTRSGVLLERLGDGLYSDVLDQYARSAGLDTTSLTMLHDAVGANGRFLALARIEDVTVTHKEETKDPDSNAKTENDETTRSTYRNVRMTFGVFDLRERREAWTAVRVGQASNDVKFSEEHSSGGGGILGILKEVVSLLGSDEPDYPEAPRSQEAIGDAIHAFAKNLPEK